MYDNPLHIWYTHYSDVLVQVPDVRYSARRLPAGWAYVLEREDGRVLARAEHVHKRLAHEQSDGDTDGDRNHRASDVDAVALCGDTTRLRQARLSVTMTRDRQ